MLRDGFFACTIDDCGLKQTIILSTVEIEIEMTDAQEASWTPVHHQFTIAMLAAEVLDGWFWAPEALYITPKKSVVVSPIENAAGLGLNLKRPVWIAPSAPRLPRPSERAAIPRPSECTGGGGGKGIKPWRRDPQSWSPFLSTPWQAAADFPPRINSERHFFRVKTF